MRLLVAGGDWSGGLEAWVWPGHSGGCVVPRHNCAQFVTPWEGTVLHLLHLILLIIDPSEGSQPWLH